MCLVIIDFRASGFEKNHVYLYTAHKPQIKLPNGIGFGGKLQPPSFRLWIDESLDFGSCRATDATYASGSLLDRLDFEIVAIEVWGSGGSAAELAQIQSKKREGVIARHLNHIN